MIIGPFLEDKEYLNFYRKMREQGKTLLLDNGAYEFERPVSAEEYLEYISKIRPNVVVLPDVWKNADDTIREARFFLENWDRKALPAKAMFVPQGSNFYEWFSCYADIFTKSTMREGTDIIGLSVGTWKDKTGIIRSFFTRHLDDQREPPMHLLGLWNVRELEFTGNRARSVDTSMPFKLAAKNMTLTKRSICADKMDFHGELKDKQVELAKTNLKSMLSIAANPRK